jgi:diaminohydroxyphosphoribosylaminopyrimidine deaminase/5-amino-6-(5-phosphoribosylamino)uracil reductase
MEFVPPFGVAAAAELMRYAADLSQKGLANTFPNPIVGALIVDDNGRILSEGYHQGGDHAEVVALKNLSGSARGLTAIVTLEPCNHTGKTPPCSEALINAGIKNVIYAVSDPNLIAKGGAEKLKQAGLNILSNVEREYVAWSNRDWLTKIKLNRPRIIWKIAATLDGKIAAKDGSAKWITGESARKSVHQLRATCDAIITSTQTVLDDDPALDTHGVSEKNPDLIVVGAREIPAQFKIHKENAKFINNRNIEDLLKVLKAKEYNRVMVEAGATFATALLKADLIDEIHFYQAPKILSGGKSFVEDLGITNINSSLNFKFHSTTMVGADILSILTRDEGN